MNTTARAPPFAGSPASAAPMVRKTGTPSTSALSAPACFASTIAEYRVACAETADVASASAAMPDATMRSITTRPRSAIGGRAASDRDLDRRRELPCLLVEVCPPALDVREVAARRPSRADVVHQRLPR